ncbi:hypothetical protein [Citrobacter sp. BDA59-3]|uniref:hypothetical protein n=1 Tax=Citrobacter sp. BDA59-3 TaxID=2781952 RepID=UPI00187FBE79|nr:hypothetical protein [Citrobacter sp. BDA59-3]QOV67573.1 hypothetical protein IP582_18185 [Citrobacter sp. BDA59-3]
MLRKSHLVAWPALIASLFLLTGCPPPPEHTNWKRASTSEQGVMAAMKGCGEPATGSVSDLPLNAQALQFLCMQHLGFTRSDGLALCALMKDQPACVAEKQGHQLSVSQLEALPFVEDEGFFPIKPGSGRNEAMQVSWRKAGASQHFSVQVANDQQALPVMYACGYPKPLGSNLAVANIGQTAKAQRCMINHGFEPKKQRMLVCQSYPQVTACREEVEKSG